MEIYKYFRKCCREQEKFVELPKNCFGPSIMCRHCGSFWNKVKHRNRLIPSKVIKKKFNFEQNDKQLSKFRSSLARKCLRGKINKMIIKCFVCSKYSQIPRNKPNSNKSLNQINNKEIQQSNKKKKRRSKDKTAGLNISLSNSFVSTPNKISTPIQKERKEIKKVLTPLVKVKNINKERLSNILNNDSGKKRNSLSNFLKELY